MSKRIIAIADIHGCRNEFQKLIDLLRLQKDQDELIILGDAIDRGYDSEGVIRMIIELKDSLGEDHVIWLKGNHEDALVNKGKGMFHKNSSPLQKYSRMMAELPLYYETEACLFVHAGFEGDYQNTQCILSDRSVLNGERIYDGSLYIAGHSPFYKGSSIPFDTPLYIDESGKTHTVYDGMKLPEKGALFIDTGCVYKNKLTALIIHEDKTIQIQSVQFSGVE